MLKKYMTKGPANLRFRRSPAGTFMPLPGTCPLWYRPESFLRYLPMLFPDYRQFSGAGEKKSQPYSGCQNRGCRPSHAPFSAFLNIAADEPRAFLLESV